MRLLWFERGGDSGKWQRSRRWLSEVDSWIGRTLDPGEMIHNLSHRWRTTAAVLGFLVLAGIAWSGVLMVGPDEVVYVRRFGRLLPEDYSPGLHWRWPWPIEVAVRTRPARIQTLEIGFRSNATGTAPGTLAWASSHGGDGLRRMPDEAVMITGDGNLLELQATVRFSLEHPRAYLFELGDAPALLRSAAESVLRETVAGHSFHELLTVNRAAFQKEVQTRLDKRCRGYGSGGLGIRLEGVALHDLHPPQEVVAAYHEVAKAMEDRDRQINEARAAALARERDAEARALEQVRQAQGEKDRQVKLAQAEATVFLDRVRMRNQLSKADEWALLSRAATALRDGQAPKDVLQDYEYQRRQKLLLQASLTDFRLFWDALARALTDREKLLLDADRLPGKRHLFLADPEALRVPVPVLPPGERSPREMPEERR
jgi:Cu+-exporting ATPase